MKFMLQQESKNWKMEPNQTKKKRRKDSFQLNKYKEQTTIIWLLQEFVHIVPCI